MENLKIDSASTIEVVRKLTDKVNQTFKRHIAVASKCESLFEFDYNDMVSRNGGLSMIKPVKSLVRSLKLQLKDSMIRVIISFLRECGKICRSQGKKGLVLYLKNCYLILQQSVSGYYPDRSNLVPRVAVTSNGIPRIIPLIHRRLIEKNNTSYLKLWLSLFSLYRVLTFPGKLKLESITSPSKGSLDEDLY